MGRADAVRKQTNVQKVKKKKKLLKSLEMNDTDLNRYSPHLSDDSNDYSDVEDEDSDLSDNAPHRQRDNGLKTLVTTLLQMSMVGYPFVLPDMIGGNGYGEDPLDESNIPSRELYIRWLQANVFMPG